MLASKKDTRFVETRIRTAPLQDFDASGTFGGFFGSVRDTFKRQNVISHETMTVNAQRRIFNKYVLDYQDRTGQSFSEKKSSALPAAQRMRHEISSMASGVISLIDVDGDIFEKNALTGNSPLDDLNRSRKQAGLDPLSEDQLRAEIDAFIIANERASRNSPSGMISDFVGSSGSALTQPTNMVITAATAPFTLGTGGILTQMARAALLEGAAGGASEALIQTGTGVARDGGTAAQRERVGLEADRFGAIRDAILYGAAFGGGFAAVGRGASNAYGSAVKHVVENYDNALIPQSWRDRVHMANSLNHTAQTAPDPQALKVHAQKTDAAIRALENNDLSSLPVSRPVKVEDASVQTSGQETTGVPEGRARILSNFSGDKEFKSSIGSITGEYEVIELDSINRGVVVVDGKVKVNPFSDTVQGVSLDADSVNNIANSLNAQKLGASDSVEEGAPLISREGELAFGSKRLAALDKVYDKEASLAGEAYRNYLFDEGFDVSGMKKPVLVKRASSEIPAPRKESRIRGLQSHLSEDVDFSDYSGGGAKEISNISQKSEKLDEAFSRKEFAEAAARAAYPDAGKGIIRAAKGDGITALFARAALGLSPDVLKIRSGIKAGNIDPKMDIGPDIEEAVQILNDLELRGKAFDQDSAMLATSPVSEQLLYMAHRIDEGEVKGTVSQSEFKKRLSTFISEAVETPPARPIEEVLGSDTVLLPREDFASLSNKAAKGNFDKTPLDYAGIRLTPHTSLPEYIMGRITGVTPSRRQRTPIDPDIVDERISRIDENQMAEKNLSEQEISEKIQQYKNADPELNDAVSERNYLREMRESGFFDEDSIFPEIVEMLDGTVEQQSRRLGDVLDELEEVDAGLDEFIQCAISTGEL